MMNTVGLKSSNNRLLCKNHEVCRQHFTKMVLCFRATGVVVNGKHENAIVFVVVGADGGDECRVSFLKRDLIKNI
jgi:hypothetical protein